MKRFSGIFLAICLLFCAVIAFPTSNLDDDAEVIVVPLEAQQATVNDRGSAATDNGSPFFSFAPYNPFRWNFGIFDEFHNIVRQLRERVHNVWSDTPADKSDPSVKSNSTSRVEYIDGRKVVINDTFYTKETEFGTSVYNVRVIDFLPVNDETTRTTATNNNGQPKFDVESVDDETDVKSNNDDELDKGSPEELDNSNNVIDINGDIDDVENFELDDDNNQQQQLQNHHQHHQQLYQHHHHQQQQPLPLEDENYTNNRLEEFMPNNSPSASSSPATESIEDESDEENANEENIYLNEHYPVDLSNDIAINQMAADQGVPYDSDAEIFSFDEHVQHPISTAYEFVPVDIKK
ncbi:hypothetical protein HA402_001569 [Bradysia odoriphaga]|nr:hypothetical protein HA402_001569 [Bradysia odoriphaga]